MVKKNTVGRTKFEECLAKAVLYDSLIKGRIELRVHEVSGTVMQEADHVSRLATHLDSVLDILLPQIITPWFAKPAGTGSRAGVGTHLPAGIPMIA